MINAIEACNITKSFGTRRAVDGISFTVKVGETFGLLGPNGAGKSTTMRMIACRSPLTDGELLVDGLDVTTEDKKIRSLLGVVPQENNLDPDLNVLENLLVYSTYFRIPKLEARKRAEDLLYFIKLEKRKNDKVDNLSGGMKRRLIIARALIHRPKILLLDEPTTGLDPNVRQEIWDKLAELRREQNITILLSTHYMDEAEKLCKRIIILMDGKIVAQGVPQDLIQSKVKKFALEIREIDGLPLQTVPSNIFSVRRGSAHIYFGETIDNLTPLISHYGTRPILLRPSNLEDVFLQLTD